MLQWIRRAFSPARDAVRGFAPPVRRTLVGALVDGYLAVRAGRSPDEHDRARLAEYACKAPQGFDARELLLVDGRPAFVGDDVRTRVLDDPSGIDGGGENAPLVRAVRARREAEQTELARKAAELRKRVGEERMQVDDAREALARRKAAELDAIASGAATPPALRAKAAPARRSRVPELVWGTAALAALVTEGYNVWPAFGDYFGVDLEDVGASWAETPHAVLGTAFVSAIAVVALYGLMHLAAAPARRLRGSSEPVRAQFADLVTALFWAAAFTAGVLALTIFRRNSGEGAIELSAAMAGTGAGGMEVPIWAWDVLMALAPIAAYYCASRREHAVHARLAREAERASVRAAEASRIDRAARDSLLTQRAEQALRNAQAELEIHRRAFAALAADAARVESVERAELETVARYRGAFLTAVERALEVDRLAFRLCGGRRAASTIVAQPRRREVIEAEVVEDERERSGARRRVS